MSSYANLRLGPIRIADDRNEIDPSTMLLFRESDKNVFVADELQRKSYIDEMVDDYDPISVGALPVS
jgi:hypothetical protein